MRRVVPVAIGAWLLMAVLAIGNGTLRQAVLIPAMGDTAAQIVSIAILAGLIGFIQWRLVHGRWLDLPRNHLLAIGAAWAVGTVLFEFGLGRFVLGMSWGELLDQYNLFAGNLWPVIPLLMALGMPSMAWNREELAA